MKLFRSIKRKVTERLSPPKPPIVLTEAGFLVGVPNGTTTEILWSDIEQVRAFKLDLFTWDEVRFVFLMSSGVALEVSEEQPGFAGMLAAAQVHFPSLVGWQTQVIKPAFARNETTLYQRKAQLCTEWDVAR